jgi:hypothetical protein
MKFGTLTNDNVKDNEVNVKKFIKGGKGGKKKRRKSSAKAAVASD